jgi:hypothetical protein
VIPEALRRAHEALALVTAARAPLSGLRLDASNPAFESTAWAHDPRVQGFGIRSSRGGGYAALVVYISDEPPRPGIPQIPQCLTLTATRAVPIEVVEFGCLRLQDATMGDAPPAPGCAIAVDGMPFGTFGCLVRDPVPSGAVYVLGAAHVMARSGFPRAEEKLFQVIDGQRREIGRLNRWGEITFTTNTYPNLFDAAIATVQKDRVSPEVSGIGRPLGVSTKVKKGMAVQMHGAKSKLSTALVIDPNFHCHFEYSRPSGPARAGFQQQILCERFTKSGDSGAAVLNGDREVIGLVIGAAQGGTVVSPIGPILTRFGIAIA